MLVVFVPFFVADTKIIYNYDFVDPLSESHRVSQPLKFYQNVYNNGAKIIFFNLKLQRPIGDILQGVRSLGV